MPLKRQVREEVVHSSPKPGHGRVLQRNISIFHAFADVLEGHGGLRNVSDPTHVVGLKGTSLPDEIREPLADIVREWDEVTVQAGDYPIPSGPRSTAAGTCCMARTHRDEHE
jgi:hypothetical protein